MGIARGGQGQRAKRGGASARPAELPKSTAGLGVGGHEIRRHWSRETFVCACRGGLNDPQTRQRQTPRVMADSREIEQHAPPKKAERVAD